MMFNFCSYYNIICAPCVILLFAENNVCWPCSNIFLLHIKKLLKMFYANIGKCGIVLMILAQDTQ